MKRKIVIISLMIILLSSSVPASIQFYEIRKGSGGAMVVESGIKSIRKMDSPLTIKVVRLDNGNWKATIGVIRYWETVPEYLIYIKDIQDVENLSGLLGIVESKKMPVFGDRLYEIELSESEMKKCLISIHQPAVDSGGVVYLIVPYKFRHEEAGKGR